MSHNVFMDDISWHKGRQIRVEYSYDGYMGQPWKEHDGHGPVRDRATKGNKKPWERLLGDGHAYDWQAAIKLAKSEGWHTGIDTFMELTAKHRRVPTRGMIAEHAVQRDFDHLQAWCDDDWHWMVIGVIDVETEVSDYCGGYESTEIGTPYLNERIEEMCEGIYVDSVEALLLSA